VEQLAKITVLSPWLLTVTSAELDRRRSCDALQTRQRDHVL